MIYQLSDPYRPPLDADGTPQAPIPGYTLYDTSAVSWAAFLGGPIPGTMIMAHNYRALGHTSRAFAALAAGLLATVGAVLLGSVLPSTTTSSVFAISLAMGVRAVARSLQGPLVDRHVNEGGKLGSTWVGVGLGMVFLLAVCAIIFPPLFSHRLNGPKIVVGTKDEIYYSGSATKEDAESLGDALKADSFLSDRGASVFLSKDDKDGTVVSFVLKEGFWDQPGVVSSFEEIGRTIAPSVGGFPIKVRLVNSTRETKKEFTVGKVIIGTQDHIYYFGQATGSDAQALGEALKSDGYFRDQGFSVMLSKDSNGTAISFVVQEGYWNAPDHVAAFANIVREIAPSVGGLPINLRLTNPALAVEKEETVH